MFKNLLVMLSSVLSGLFNSVLLNTWFILIGSWKLFAKFWWMEITMMLKITILSVTHRSWPSLWTNTQRLNNSSCQIKLCHNCLTKKKYFYLGTRFSACMSRSSVKVDTVSLYFVKAFDYVTHIVINTKQPISEIPLSQSNVSQLFF